MPIRVEVVRALREEQVLVALDLEEGATAREAVLRSGILAGEPGTAAAPLVLGIYGRVVPAGTPLRDGDRVEVYRPLAADPSSARRARARWPRARRD